MNNKEGANRLNHIISETIGPLIGSKCALYDTPFYKNIGDVLIWQGELSFLEENNIDILDFADYHTYIYKGFSEDVTILFQGGGNIGDLYHEHTDMLLRLVDDYPNNRIIVFSQTVHYQDNNLFINDFKKLARHKDLFFCARDYEVYNRIKPIIGEKALCLPDMAFCINPNFLQQWALPEYDKYLYIKRNDVEAGKSGNISAYNKVSDWPCFETKFLWSNVGNTLFDRSFKYMPFFQSYIRDPWKSYAKNRFKNLMIKDGVEFISPFRNVTSERLHGCILSILLGKKVTVVNNSYGKNLNFYNSWLKDFENVSLLNL